MQTGVYLLYYEILVGCVDSGCILIYISHLDDTYIILN